MNQGRRLDAQRAALLIGKHVDVDSVALPVHGGFVGAGYSFRCAWAAISTRFNLLLN